VKGSQKEHRDFQSALQRLSMPVTTVIVREGPLQRKMSNLLARAVRSGRMKVDSMGFKRVLVLIDNVWKPGPKFQNYLHPQNR
jgi:hypothetical protein